VDDRRPTSPLHELSEPIGSDAAPFVYCGTDQHVSEGFANALQVMGLGATFLPVGIALATNTPNTEDN
jgi:hypothetical protein